MLLKAGVILLNKTNLLIEFQPCGLWLYHHHLRPLYVRSKLLSVLIHGSLLMPLVLTLNWNLDLERATLNEPLKIYHLLPYQHRESWNLFTILFSWRSDLEVCFSFCKAIVLFDTPSGAFSEPLVCASKCSRALWIQCACSRAVYEASQVFAAPVVWCSNFAGLLHFNHWIWCRHIHVHRMDLGNVRLSLDIAWIFEILWFH